MTLATSAMTAETVQDGGLLDVSVGTCKRLLEMAYKNYNECMKLDHKSAASYWDGYIRGIQHVLEAHEQ